MIPPSFLIRAARPDDAPMIERQFKAMGDELLPLGWEKGPETAQGEVLRAAEEMIASPHCCALVAELEGRPCGYILASADPRDVYCKVAGIYVEEWARRGGMATRMYREVEEWARRRGVKLMLAEILPGNRTETLLKRQGYRGQAVINMYKNLED